MGTGIHRIQKSLRDAKLPEAKFDYSSVITLTFPRVFTDADRNRSMKKVGEKVGEKLTKNPKRILQILLKNNTASAQQVAEQFSISKRKTEENFRKLREQGLIKRVGPARGGHWEVADSSDS